MFGGMLFFVCIQLFCFYKGGMVFTPFYNYGMYSEVMDVKPEYEINGVGHVKGNDFSPQSWDKIYYTLGQYQSLDKNDSLYANEVIRLFAKAHLLQPATANFIRPLSPADFNAWYAACLKQAGIQSDSYNWKPSIYSWNGYALMFSKHH